MSDVNIAPPAPPSAPSAPANEVPINQNPVGSPQPVGDQAPEKPVDGVDRGHGRPETRRESIRKAFERANSPEKEKTPAPRKAKAVADDKTAPDDKPLDLRKPPQDRYREGGRFAKSPEAAATRQQDPALGQQAQQTARKPSPPLPETAPYREPPGRWADHAKAEWSAAPESVRGEVYRMAKEFDGAYQKLRGDHETMDKIRPYHEMATQHGTTLERALNNYVSMEQKLRTDLVGGLDVIVNNLNLHTQDGRKLGLRDVAYHILNQSPEQHKLTQQHNASQAAQHQIGALHQEVAGLKSTISQLHNGLQFNYTRSQVDQFADDPNHPGFDELGDLIEQELRFGFSLEEAYQRAARLRPPTTRAAQTRTPPAQTRPDKSIHGAPDTGPSDGQRRKGDKPVGRREAIQRAIQRVNGGV